MTISEKDVTARASEWADPVSRPRLPRPDAVIF